MKNYCKSVTTTKNKKKQKKEKRKRERLFPKKALDSCVVNVDMNYMKNKEARQQKL